MNDSMVAELERLFLALSDKTRLRLLALMANGEVPVGFLADQLQESQPKISRHLAYLRTSGLVATRRDGKWIYYGIASQAPAAAYVLNATFSSLAGDQGPSANPQLPVERSGDAYKPHDPDIWRETDTSHWEPAEIDVFLL